MHPRTMLGIGVLVLAAADTGGFAQDWPGWRGAQRDGVVAAGALPRQWPGEVTRVWQVEVGTGHASPVVVQGQAYVFARQDEEEIVRRMDVESGDIQWEKRYPAPYEMHSAARRHGKGPKATPAIADGRLITFGISGILSCWHTESGDRLWKNEFADEYAKTSPAFGVAASPLIVEGLCIVAVGGKDAGALIALDVESGRPRWKWEGDGPAYASPVQATLDGVRQVITQSQSSCISVDLASGKLLWQLPFKTAYDQNSVTPLVVGDMVLFSGLDEETFAVRPERKSEGWDIDVVWRNKETSMYMSTAVVVGDTLFGMSHRRQGHFFMANLSDGAAVWVGPGRQANNAAVLTDGTSVVALTDAGELIAWDATGVEPQEVARYKVADRPTWAHPVPLGDRVLVKDESSVALWRFGS